MTPPMQMNPRMRGSFVPRKLAKAEREGGVAALSMERATIAGGVAGEGNAFRSHGSRADIVLARLRSRLRDVIVIKSYITRFNLGAVAPCYARGEDRLV